MDVPTFLYIHLLVHISIFHMKIDIDIDVDIDIDKYRHIHLHTDDTAQHKRTVTLFRHGVVTGLCFRHVSQCRGGRPKVHPQHAERARCFASAGPGHPG